MNPRDLDAYELDLYQLVNAYLDMVISKDMDNANEIIDLVLTFDRKTACNFHYLLAERVRHIVLTIPLNGPEVYAYTKQSIRDDRKRLELEERHLLR